MKNRPVIGIISARHVSGALLPAYTTNSHYPEEVKAAGGIPVQLPLMAETSHEDAETLISLCDGFLLPGGGDFHPSWYGETLLPNLHPGSFGLDLKTQAIIVQLVRAMVASEKPILGICLGMQVLNIALGGSLYQDIPTQIETDICHGNHARVLEDRWKLIHPVRTAEGSLIRSISESEEIPVNSFHHQAVKAIASDFTATAWAPDGIVEAMEHKDQKIIGVQWHPESLSHAGMKPAQNLFRWLIDTAQG